MFLKTFKGHHVDGFWVTTRMASYSMRSVTETLKTMNHLVLFNRPILVWICLDSLTFTRID